jgi:hypothetical protein
VVSAGACAVVWCVVFQGGSAADSYAAGGGLLAVTRGCQRGPSRPIPLRHDPRSWSERSRDKRPAELQTFRTGWTDCGPCRQWRGRGGRPRAQRIGLDLARSVASRPARASGTRGRHPHPWGGASHRARESCHGRAHRISPPRK